MPDEYRRFGLVCQRATEREWLLAEAFEAGAAGVEESECPGVGDDADALVFCASIFASAERIDGVRRSLRALAIPGVEIGPIEALPEVDWREAWKEGLEALVVSPRLVVRPPFAARPLAPGQREVVIDPGQAFGTGTHASTRLCLEWLDRLLAGPSVAFESVPSVRVIDVGTGSGVLALAALALGAGSAVGFDLDPVASRAAAMAARDNGLGARAAFFAGPIEALAESASRSPLVVANLLKRELLPITAEIAARLAPGGRLILAGLLVEDVAEVCSAFRALGLVEVGRREIEDAVGCWVGLCLAPRQPSQVGRASRSDPSS